MSLRDDRKQQSRYALLEAALRLSHEQGGFQSLSLREVARAAGLVPAGFYRHFKDMNELGSDLADHIALSLHRLRKSLRDAFSLPTLSVQQTVERILYQVAQEPTCWQFLVRERYSGSPSIRQAIDRELAFFSQDLASDLIKTPFFKQLNSQDAGVLADCLINLSLNWVMGWLSLRQQVADNHLEQKAQLILQATRQIQMLFQGAVHWTSDSKAASRA